VVSALIDAKGGLRMLLIAKLATRAFIVTVPLLALAACTQPSAESSVAQKIPPAEPTLAQRLKRDCADAARLLVAAEGTAQNVKDDSERAERVAAREDQLVGVCIRRRATQFINGGPR
jgi:hypothetical protein